MLKGLGSFVALLLAFSICVVHPSLASVALIGIVAALVVLEEVWVPRGERDR